MRINDGLKNKRSGELKFSGFIRIGRVRHVLALGHSHPLQASAVNLFVVDCFRQWRKRRQWIVR
jgi:hypothetical protein